MELGYELIGAGQAKVIVLHDWFCDHSSYAPIFSYLNQRDFQYAFLDVRGYGLSRRLEGSYSLDEVTKDVLDTADKLGWNQFHLVGYSMTGLVGQNILAVAQARVLSFIAIVSVPANGYSVAAEESTFAFLSAAALADDEKALQIPQMMTSGKYDEFWNEYKVKRWRETSNAGARQGYLSMFVKSNIVSKIKGLSTVILVICAAEDNEALRLATMQATFGQWYPNAEIVELGNCGHNPMQEVPVLLASTINRFLSKVSASQSVAAAGTL